MSQVCYDWTPVGYSSHPIPGDPDAVAHAANAFRSTANRLSQAANALRRLDSPETDSLAVEKIISKAREVAGLLDQVYDRYDVAAGALASYSPALAHAQQQAEQALRAATQAKQDHDVAHNNATQLWWHAKGSTDPQQRQELLQTFYAQKSRADQASSSLSGARAQVEAAIHARDGAASNAAQRIDTSTHHREINDSLFDHLKEAWDAAVEITTWVLDHDPVLKALVEGVKAVVKWIWDNIDTIATVLTIAAFALSWIPGVGQVALVLAIAARVAATISTVKSFVQLGQALFTSFSTGDWGPFIQAAGTFAVSFALSKVAGKVLSKASKSAFRELAVESQRQTGSLRTANNAVRGKLATPSYHPGHNPLASLTPRGAKADSLVATFKGTDYTSKVEALGQVVHIAESHAAKQALEQALEPVKQAGEQLVDKGVDYYETHYGPSKVSQTCSPSFTGAGAGGGW